MKKVLLFAIAILGLVTWFVVDLLIDAGHFKEIEPHFAGSCERLGGLSGPEDVTIHPETGVAFISAFDRRALVRGEAVNGAIYAYDLQGESPDLVDLTAGLDLEFRPHGLSLYRGEDGSEALFVINHQQSGHFVEIFDVAGGTLVHRESIRGPLLASPNDLVAVGPRSFYATNDHGNTSPLGRWLEDYLRLKRSNVVFFDGSEFTVAAEGMAYANGINVSADGGSVFVAATTEGTVRRYRRDASTGALELEEVIDLDTGVDNLEVDAEGNIWAGAHPQLLVFVDHADDPATPAPSQVLRIPASGEPPFEEVFLSRGDDLSASSVGAVFEDWLLIGAVFGDHILVCKMEEG